ncbi:MAG: Uma2 family endonuclease [Chloroflexota bacterium]
MAIRDQVMTVEAFWEQYANQPFELIEGEVSPVAPTGNLHGLVGSRVIAQLRYFVDARDLGEVYSSETGFYLTETTMRAADAAFVCEQKLSLITETQKFVPFAPDLAVEIVSPGDSASEIQKKVDLYLAAGTSIVWVIYPDLKKVVVYSGDKGYSVPFDGTLDGGDLLPGLKLPVSKLFPPELAAAPQEES